MPQNYQGAEFPEDTVDGRAVVAILAGMVLGIGFWSTLFLIVT